MATHLLDTSVCSQPLKKRPVMAALRRWQQLGDTRCTTTAVCTAEIEWGLHKLSSPRHWQIYHGVLQPGLVVICPDAEAWSRFALMKARQYQLGRPLADLDLLIAAVAVQRDLILATLNARHFALVEGLCWEDWSK
jgi:predicted nucleic acid-binding protein